MKRLYLLALTLLLVTLTVPAIADEKKEVGGELTGVMIRDGQEVEVKFPLEHTAVKATVSGFVARVDVTQTYGNPYDQKIEAVYTFPLPHEAAVDNMVMKIGERIIKGEIMKRQEAKEVYEKAKQAGKTVALLEQERPNIFTQSVANIQPGDKIEIMISYVDILPYEAGEYEFVFPMVVGPRYMPGKPLKRADTGSGWAQDTDKVPDASRISPPILPEGMRSGHDIELELEIDAGVPLVNYDSPSHKIDVEKSGKSELIVKLSPQDTIPNKDFIFKYYTAGEELETALLSHTQDGDAYFTLIMQPKSDYDEREIVPKEMFFVLDTSGSMYGYPLEVSKAVATKCIEGMNLEDTFQVVRFNTQAESLFEKPLANSVANIKKGIAAINGLSGYGGTDPLSAVRKIAAIPHDPERLRIIFFMTDGYVGNDTEIIDELPKQLKNCRVFVLGVGSSPNRYLLDGMAEAGRGAVQYVQHGEQADGVSETFYRRISEPCLMDIKVDWTDLDPNAEIFPYPIPDLFANQPLYLHGKCAANAGGTITVTGVRPGRDYSETLVIDFRTSEKHPTMAKVWARQKIKSLERAKLKLERTYSQNQQQDIDTLVEMITQTALKYKLMSQYTSFVAVEETPRGEGGEPMKVVQPVELPENMSREKLGEMSMVGLSASGTAYYTGAPAGAGKAMKKSVNRTRSQDGAPHVRGGRNNETKWLVDGFEATAPNAKPDADSTVEQEEATGEDRDDEAKPKPYQTIELTKANVALRVELAGDPTDESAFLAELRSLHHNLQQMALKNEIPLDKKLELKITVNTDGSLSFQFHAPQGGDFRTLEKLLRRQKWAFQMQGKSLRASFVLVRM